MCVLTFQANPCLNGGTCFDFINSYKCICPNGYIGRHCEENYDDCRNAPCANGGTCTDGVNDFTCACAPGYTGKDCSLEVNECELLDPCLNGGFCIDGNNTFACRCLPRFGGRSCEIRPDGSLDPRYHRLDPKLRAAAAAAASGRDDDAGEGSNMALVAGVSVVVPLAFIIGAVAVVCMKQRRKHEQRRADFEAHLENELNAVQSVNKTKLLDDHLIVNSLDYPSSGGLGGGGGGGGGGSVGGSGFKSSTMDAAGFKMPPPPSSVANPNLADEETFAAKDVAYSRSKPLNTEKAFPHHHHQQQQQHAEKSFLQPEYGADSRYINYYAQQHHHQHQQLLNHSPGRLTNNNNTTSKAKSTNLDVSSSTLCSSSR